MMCTFLTGVGRHIEMCASVIQFIPSWNDQNNFFISYHFYKKLKGSSVRTCYLHMLKERRWPDAPYRKAYKHFYFRFVRFVLYLVGNPEDWFSQDSVYIMSCLYDIVFQSSRLTHVNILCLANRSSIILPI